jgi:hypothetical protein
MSAGGGLFGDGGDQRIPLTAGSLVVVPRGRWHRHVDAVNLVELYLTPGQSLRSNDPSTASGEEGCC